MVWYMMEHLIMLKISTNMFTYKPLKCIFSLQQENEILNMENRNYFSLHCVQMESQLVHANMESLYVALHDMSMEEATAHSEVGSTDSQ